MDARLTYPDAAIDAVRGQVAVERGPLVLALESMDLPGGMTMDTVRIDVDGPVVTTPDGARVDVVAALSPPRDWAYGPDGDGARRRPGRRRPCATPASNSASHTSAADFAGMNSS
mgnify:CR=1 FL=1